MRLLLAVESIHRLLPLLLRRAPVQPKIRVLSNLTQILNHIESGGPVGDDDYLL